MREMKNSGLEWLGSVPDEWECIPSKYLFHEIRTLRYPDDIRMTSSVKYGIISQEEYRKIEQFNVIDASQNLEKWKHVEPFDFVISLMSFKSGIEMSEVVGCVTWHYIVLRASREVNPYYYKWLFKSTEYCKALSRTCNFIRNGQDLRFSNFSKVGLPVPPLHIQKGIAEYLNGICSEIDALSADIQSEIDTLEEYKRSVITETVTKGLDPSVEMKDSGIEWIGMIPKDWEVHRLSYYFSERKNINTLLREDNLQSLSYGRIVRKDINTVGGLLPASYNTYNIIEKGDIVIRPTDLQNDKRSLRTGLVKEHGIITSAYITLKPQNSTDTRYYHYLLHVYDVLKVFYNMGNGVRQGLNYDEFAKLIIFSPSQEEQVDIADFLDEKCSEIDTLIKEKQNQLTLLADYKKSLIYEYVTGKKEVPANAEV